MLQEHSNDKARSNKNHLSDARKNASYQVVIGQFSFESDWLRKWREFSESIAQRGNPKPKQSQMIFYLENSRHFLDQSDLLAHGFVEVIKGKRKL